MNEVFKKSESENIPANVTDVVVIPRERYDELIRAEAMNDVIWRIVNSCPSYCRDETIGAVLGIPRTEEEGKDDAQ